MGYNYRQVNKLNNDLDEISDILFCLKQYKQFKNKSISVFAGEEQIKINNKSTLESLYSAFHLLSIDLREEIKDEIDKYTV
jgi:hypothetical protein